MKKLLLPITFILLSISLTLGVEGEIICKQGDEDIIIPITSVGDNENYYAIQSPSELIYDCEIGSSLRVDGDTSLAGPFVLSAGSNIRGDLYEFAFAGTFEKGSIFGAGINDFRETDLISFTAKGASISAAARDIIIGNFLLDSNQPYTFTFTDYDEENNEVGIIIDDENILITHLSSEVADDSEQKITINKYYTLNLEIGDEIQFLNNRIHVNFPQNSNIARSVKIPTDDEKQIIYTFEPASSGSATLELNSRFVDGELDEALSLEQTHVLTLISNTNQNAYFLTIQLPQGQTLDETFSFDEKDIISFRLIPRSIRENDEGITSVSYTSSFQIQQDGPDRSRINVCGQAFTPTDEFDYLGQGTEISFTFNVADQSSCEITKCSFAGNDEIGQSQTNLVCVNEEPIVQIKLPFKELEFLPTGEGTGVWTCTDVFCNNVEFILNRDETWQTVRVPVLDSMEMINVRGETFYEFQAFTPEVRNLIVQSDSTLTYFKKGEQNLELYGNDLTIGDRLSLVKNSEIGLENDGVRGREFIPRKPTAFRMFLDWDPVSRRVVGTTVDCCQESTGPVAKLGQSVLGLNTYGCQVEDRRTSLLASARKVRMSPVRTACTPEEFKQQEPEVTEEGEALLAEAEEFDTPQSICQEKTRPSLELCRGEDGECRGEVSRDYNACLEDLGFKQDTDILAAVNAINKVTFKAGEEATIALADAGLEKEEYEPTFEDFLDRVKFKESIEDVTIEQEVVSGIKPVLETERNVAKIRSDLEKIKFLQDSADEYERLGEEMRALAEETDEIIERGLQAAPSTSAKIKSLESRKQAIEKATENLERETETVEPFSIEELVREMEALQDTEEERADPGFVERAEDLVLNTVREETNKADSAKEGIDNSAQQVEQSVAELRRTVGEPVLEEPERVCEPNTGRCIDDGTVEFCTRKGQDLFTQECESNEVCLPTEDRRNAYCLFNPRVRATNVYCCGGDLGTPTFLQEGSCRAQGLSFETTRNDITECVNAEEFTTDLCGGRNCCTIEEGWNWGLRGQGRYAQCVVPERP